MSDQSIISYWKNFEIINKDLNNLLSKSRLHNYEFPSSSEAKCLICSGKVIIDLSKDEYNRNIYAFEIGVITNKDMLYREEYIFKYEDEESQKENLNNFKDDFLSFQKENLNNIDINLECELLNGLGYAYGSVFKIPQIDD